MSVDIFVQANGSVNQNKTIQRPPYLLYVQLLGEKKVKYFLCLDRPDTQPAFVQVKGFFVDKEEETIITTYGEIITDSQKESVIEIMIPWAQVKLIRNLVFKAK